MRVRILSSQGKDKLGILFEQWIQCEGHWSESSLTKSSVSATVTARGVQGSGSHWVSWSRSMEVPG